MFRHLLVSLDGTRRAEAAIACSLELAKIASANVLLVRVVNTMGAQRARRGERGRMGMAARSDALHAEAADEAAQYLDRHARNIRAYGVDVATEVRFGEPAAEIVAGALEHSADTMILATNARRGMDRLMLGSVAERVVAISRVPVILLRA